MYKLNINLKVSASNRVIKIGIDADIKWLHAAQSALDKHTTGKEMKHKTVCVFATSVAEHANIKSTLVTNHCSFDSASWMWRSLLFQCCH